MLAPSQISENFSRWNKQVGSPFGLPIPLAKKLKRILPKSWYWRLRGPFSIQRNNSTREFEYPFVYEKISKAQAKTILDFGGGLSGMQFVLAREGYHVINVDPGMEARGKGWPCTIESIGKLNKLFRTSVELRNTTIDNANIKENSIDTAISISVIEHLPWTEIETAMKCVWSMLKPGGRFILTIDLFLDVYPFSEANSNKYGTNIDLKKLVEVAPFFIEWGEKNELFGFDEFSMNNIVQNKKQYLVGEGYPTLVQCLVLRKQLD